MGSLELPGRALVVIDTEGRMVHMTLHNEYARSYPEKVLELIRHQKNEDRVVKKSTSAAGRAVRPGVFDNEQFFICFCFLPKLSICYVICSVFFLNLNKRFRFRLRK